MHVTAQRASCGVENFVFESDNLLSLKLIDFGAAAQGPDDAYLPDIAGGATPHCITASLHTAC